MSNTDKLIAYAKSQVGYLEKRSNSQLDSFTANAGDRNYTKFGRDYTRYTGSNLQGSAWCACFVSCCFAEAYGLENAKKMLGGGLFCSCTVGRDRLKKLGRYDNIPRVGDLIFFTKLNSNDLAHVGIVYKFDAARVYTIEGNTSSTAGVIANGGAVAYKSYTRGYKRIAGYGHPLYDSAAVTSTQTKTEVVKKVTITLNELAKGSKGEQVKTVQRLLNAISGAKLEVDGDFGTATDKAVKAYQAAKKLAVDGCVGTNTWKKMLGGGC